jgi:hypothetical protein
MDACPTSTLPKQRRRNKNAIEKNHAKIKERMTLKKKQPQPETLPTIALIVRSGTPLRQDNLSLIQ